MVLLRQKLYHPQHRQDDSESSVVVSVLDFQGLVFGSVLLFVGAVKEADRARNGGQRAYLVVPPKALTPKQSAQTTVGDFEPVDVPDGTILAVLVQITFTPKFDPSVFLGLLASDTSTYVLVHCLRVAHVLQRPPMLLTDGNVALSSLPDNNNNNNNNNNVVALTMRNYCYPMSITMDEILFGTPEQLDNRKLEYADAGVQTEQQPSSFAALTSATSDDRRAVDEEANQHTMLVPWNRNLNDYDSLDGSALTPRLISSVGTSNNNNNNNNTALVPHTPLDSPHYYQGNRYSSRIPGPPNANDRRNTTQPASLPIPEEGFDDDSSRRTGSGDTVTSFPKQSSFSSSVSLLADEDDDDDQYSAATQEDNVSLVSNTKTKNGRGDDQHSAEAQDNVSLASTASSEMDAVERIHPWSGTPSSSSSSLVSNRQNGSSRSDQDGATAEDDEVSVGTSSSSERGIDPRRIVHPSTLSSAAEEKEEEERIINNNERGNDAGEEVGNSEEDGNTAMEVVEPEAAAAQTDAAVAPEESTTPLSSPATEEDETDTAMNVVDATTTTEEKANLEEPPDDTSPPLSGEAMEVVNAAAADTQTNEDVTGAEEEAAASSDPPLEEVLENQEDAADGSPGTPIVPGSDPLKVLENQEDAADGSPETALEGKVLFTEEEETTVNDAAPAPTPAPTAPTAPAPPATPKATVYAPESPVELSRLVEWMKELHQFNHRLFSKSTCDGRVLVQGSNNATTSTAPKTMMMTTTPPPQHDDAAPEDQGTGVHKYQESSTAEQNVDGQTPQIYGTTLGTRAGARFLGSMSRRRKRPRDEPPFGTRRTMRQRVAGGNAVTTTATGSSNAAAADNNDWSAFLYVFHQIGTLFSKMQFHPAMYYLRAVPDRDIDVHFAVNPSGEASHQTSDEAVYLYMTQLLKASSSTSSSSSSSFKVDPALRKGLLTKSETRMTNSKRIDKDKLAALFAEFRSRTSILLLDEDGTASAAKKKKTGATRAPTDSDRSLNAALEILTAPEAGEPERKVRAALDGNYKDELSLFTLLFLVSDTPGFLNFSEESSNKTPYTVMSIPGRQRLLRAVAEQCMEVLPVCSAIVELISGQSPRVMARLRDLAQKHTRSLLGTFLYLRVDRPPSLLGNLPSKVDPIPFCMNARYRVFMDLLNLKSDAAVWNTANNVPVVTDLRARHESIHVEYNDDSFQYYDRESGAPLPVSTWMMSEAQQVQPQQSQKKTTKSSSLASTNNYNLLPSAAAKPPNGPPPSQPPSITVRPREKAPPPQVCNRSHDQIVNVPVPLLRGNKNANAPNQIKFSGYDRSYVLGPFSQVFGPTTTTESMAEDMTVAMDALAEGRPVMIMGYGASGAGKTSALVYLKDEKKGGVGKKPGIVIHLCNIMAQKHQWTRVQLVVHEMYARNADVLTPQERKTASGSSSGSSSKIEPTYRRVPSGEGGEGGGQRNNYLEFVFNARTREFVLATSITLPVHHSYRFDDEAHATKAATFTAGSSTLGDVLVHLIDQDRFTKTTPNNPQSSRSHVVALLTFVRNDGKSSLLALGDFAGMENEFACDSEDTLARLRAPKRSWKNAELFEDNDDADDNNDGDEEESVGGGITSTSTIASTRGGSLSMSALSDEFSKAEQEYLYTKLWVDRDPSWKTKPINLNMGNYKDAVSRPMDVNASTSVYLKTGTTTKSSSQTVKDLGKKAVRNQLRRIPLPPPNIDKEWVFSMATLDKILQAYYDARYRAKDIDRPTIQNGFWKGNMVTIVTWLNGEANGPADWNGDLFYFFGGLLVQLQSAMKLYGVFVDRRLPAALSSSSSSPAPFAKNPPLTKAASNFTTGMVHAVAKCLTVVRSQNFIGEAELDLQEETLVRMRDTMEGVNEATKQAHADLSRYLDTWWDPKRYQDDVNTVLRKRNSNNVREFDAQSEKLLADWETILWIRGQRFRSLVLGHMCLDRRVEGSYINRSVGHLREDIQTIVDVKCAAVSTPPIPPILPDLVSDYCPAYSRSCLLPAAAAVGFVRDDANKRAMTRPTSDMLDVVFQAWRRGGQQPRTTATPSSTAVTTAQSELNTFYEQLYPCIFCVANLSRGADNPPPIPYIDSTKLRLLVGEFQNVLMGDWRQEFNDPPQTLVKAATATAKTDADTEAKMSLMRPVVNVDKRAKRKEFVDACKELVCRVHNRYDGKHRDGMKSTISSMSTAILGVEADLRASNNSDKDTTMRKMLYASLHDLAVEFIQKLDLSNASSTMGSLEFLDRSAKYNRTNVMATDIELLCNEKFALMKE